jgi:RNA recognition motif-containing protein
MNIYVGNLAGETTEDDLREAFGAFGQVTSVKILKDRVTGESNGFGFIGMAESEEGKAAISGLNGKDLAGNAIKVEEGRAKTTFAPPASTGRDGRRDSAGGRDGGRGGRGGFDHGDRGDRGGRGDRGDRGGRR